MARAVDPAGLTGTVVVLAGGRGTRLGGAHKPQLVVAGRSLLDHLLDGIPATVAVIVVGPPQPAGRPVRFCREDPPYGGPVAALAAAVPLVESSSLGLVAADMPSAGEPLGDLLVRWSGEEALVPVDQVGRRQPLCSVFDTAAIRRALATLGPPAGRSMRDLVALLSVTEVVLGPRQSAQLVDVDEPADLDSVVVRPGAIDRE